MFISSSDVSKRLLIVKLENASLKIAYSGKCNQFVNG
jgi:hypothetical protein